MRDKIIIGGNEGGRVCAGGGYSSGVFCVESFTLSEMEDKLPHGADK